LTNQWATVGLLAIATLISESGASAITATPPLQLQSIADIPLGGHPTRLDYASLDARRHLLFTDEGHVTQAADKFCCRTERSAIIGG